MIDWNKYMAEAFEKLAYNPKKREQTPSEKMQDELEPIPISCPMDEYYDEINDVEKNEKK